MKSFAVVLVVTMSLCGFFTHSNGLSCYQCSWTDTSCATEKTDSKLKKIDCATAPAPGGAPTPAPGGAPTPAPGGAPTPAPGGAPTPAPGGAPTPAPGGPSTPAPGGPSTPAPAKQALFKNNKLFHGMADPTYYCFKVNIKANSSATPAVERGCKTTNKADDCVVIDKAAHATAVAESCVVCSKDNCNGNGQSMVTGSAVQCALISSLVVAKMFFQTK
ncbi:zinc finger and BTB domain-containing protein 45-like [Rhopalosiphum padi]|uniref:zinc finger and BTB domain-containing protein 45-like n=1 Tax=Rhopalosiphum padi TaxID=40932 RepID=UPI00298EA27B|nr:zinc finger and BTB domain-containing protein 45-like [Rhopalosiphum padi]